MGDGPVLAKNTAEVAVGKKDGAGAIVSHQGDLLPNMGVGAEDHHFGGSLADAFLALLPVDSAPSGTELTVLKEGISLFYPLGEFSLAFEFFISRTPWFLLFWLGRIGDRWEEQRTP
jgi:hypothetical protein